MNGSISKLARCAIYTRKSTEYNLELAFNSLDAQREACEAASLRALGSLYMRVEGKLEIVLGRFARIDGTARELADGSVHATDIP